MTKLGKYKIQFEDIPNLVEIYKTLLDDGVDPAKMDTGWQEPEGHIGAGDGEIHELEFLGYLYDNWQQYQEVLEKNTQLIVPWSLDDKDPSTDFDEKIREHITTLIEGVKKHIHDLGIEPNTRTYRMALALELFERTLSDPMLLKGISETGIEHKLKAGLMIASFSKHEEELTALQMLQDKIGQCTELSKVLFTIYSMAGLKCRGATVAVGENGNYMSHMALQVELSDDNWITVDPSLRKFNPKYMALTPLSNLGFAAAHYFNTYAIQTAALLYPPFGYWQQANALFKEGRFKEAYDSLKKYYSHPDDLTPEIIYLNYLKHSAEDKTLYAAELEGCLKTHPDMFNKIATYIRDEAELELLGDIAVTPEQKKTFHRKAIEYYYHNNNPLEMSRHMDELVISSPTKEDYRSCINASLWVGDIDSVIKYSEQYVDSFGDDINTYSALATTYYTKAKHLELIELADMLKKKGMITDNILTVSARSIAIVQDPETAISFIEENQKGDGKPLLGLRFLLDLATGNIKSAEDSLDDAFGDSTKWFGKALISIARSDYSAASDAMASHVGNATTEVLITGTLVWAPFLPEGMILWLKQRQMLQDKIQQAAEDGTISLAENQDLFQDIDYLGNLENEFFAFGLIRREIDRSPVFASLWQESALTYFKDHIAFAADEGNPDAATVSFLDDDLHFEGDKPSIHIRHFTGILSGDLSLRQKNCSVGDEGCVLYLGPTSK